MKKIICSLSLIVVVTACKKTELPVQQEQEITTASTQKSGGSSTPTVTTNAATTITSATATSGGSVSSSGGGSQVTERGICYNTSTNPRITNNKVPSGSGSGDFVSIISGLAGNTTYYVRAYAIKNNSTVYGNQVVFTTLQDYGTVTDFDGNVYNTITIGSQVWTVQNLKTTHYRNGTTIPNVTDNTAWAALSTGAYCNYNNDVANVAIYGRLYNWYAATDANNIAPAGWHLPSYTEYETLINYLGGLNIAGGKAKEAGLEHWLSPNAGADNSSGFTALPAGSRYYLYNGPTSAFLHLGYSDAWWTSTSSGTNNARFTETEWYNTYFFRSGFLGGIGYYDKRTGYSIRLVKD